MYEISKHDWKLFRDNVGTWQERYMEQLCNKYLSILQSTKPASEKFWALEKSTKIEKRKKGVLIELQKSNAVYDTVYFLMQDIITMNDLADFSDDFKETVQYIKEIHTR